MKCHVQKSWKEKLSYNMTNEFQDWLKGEAQFKVSQISKKRKKVFFGEDDGHYIFYW